MSEWVTIEAERVLYVSDGRHPIVCDRGHVGPVTLIVKLRNLEESAVATFLPVTTLADLETLDHEQIIEGYRTAERGDPEPGENRGRAFWHGWRMRQIDYGVIKSDAGHWNLVTEVVEAAMLRAHALEGNHIAGVRP